MKFFKGDAPPVEDYDKTVSKLLKLGWLSEIFDVESNKSIYEITSTGSEYYFLICIETGYEQLFNGPRLAEGQTEVLVDEIPDLVEEGFVVNAKDGKYLTPIAAEYLYVMINSLGKDIRSKKRGAKAPKSGTMNKIGKYSAMFMRGVQKASEAAQEYDKQSTASTQNFWGNDEDSSKKKSEAKKKKKSEAKKKKKKKSEAKKRKKSVNTKKNTEFGFDFGKIGRNFGFL
jgi:hypothetical protein